MSPFSLFGTVRGHGRWGKRPHVQTVAIKSTWLCECDHARELGRGMSISGDSHLALTGQWRKLDKSTRAREEGRKDSLPVKRRRKKERKFFFSLCHEILLTMILYSTAKRRETEASQVGECVVKSAGGGRWRKKRREGFRRVMRRPGNPTGQAEKEGRRGKDEGRSDKNIAHFSPDGQVQKNLTRTKNSSSTKVAKCFFLPSSQRC